MIELASRLVRGDGAILDLLDPETGNLRWAYDDGIRRLFSEEERAKLWISVGEGATGIAVAEDRVIVAGDDLDSLFPPGPENTNFYARTGFRSMITAPISGETGPLGVIEVYSVRPNAFDDADARLIRALASQSAIAITNARLITELAASKAELARTAEAERTLREIAARVSSILDPDEVLGRIVEEAARLLESDGSRIDLWDEGSETLKWAYSAGDAMAIVPDWAPTRGIKPGQAVAGLAFAEQRPVMTPDYLSDDRFEAAPEIRAFIDEAGIRAVIAVPLTGEDARPLGVLSVVSRQPGAYSETEVETLTALATHASIAIGNAKLVDALARSQADVARRADSERSLRDIAARITALRDADEILQDVVDAARRLLRADGAHLTRMAPSGGYLIPAVVADDADTETREWLIGMRFPLGGGINGLAAQGGNPIWTSNYSTDARIPHDEGDEGVARRMGLVGMAAAPLRAPGGEVIGTLAVSTETERTFDADDLDLLQGLADQAAIALTNSNLLERVTQEEARYRYLVQNAPDLIWSIGPDARLTFLSDAVERLTGFRPDELIGEHFGALVHDSSREVAEIDWTRQMEHESQEVRGRLHLRHRDGSAVPAEFIAIASLDPMDGSPVRTGRSATCASAIASSATCANPRIGIETWRRRRRISSSRRMPKAATRSCRIGRPRCSAGIATRPSAAISRNTWHPAGRPRRPRATRRSSPTRRPCTPPASTSSWATARRSSSRSTCSARSRMACSSASTAWRATSPSGFVSSGSSASPRSASVPDPELSRHRVLDRRRGKVHVPVGRDRADAGNSRRRCDRPAFLDPHRPEHAAAGRQPLGGARREPGPRDPGRPVPQDPRRGERAGRRPGDRHRRGRQVRRHPGRDARRERPGPARRRAPTAGR